MEWISTSHAPERLSGNIRLPASKSISNRALIIQALCKESFAIHNLSEADDTRLLYHVLHTDEEDLYIRNAGTAMRFLTAYFAARESEVVLRGSARMNERPIQPLVEALQQLGAHIQYLEKPGYTPLYIEGKKLNGGRVRVDASMSSQYISALLLVAPTFSEGLVIQLEGNIASIPYIHLTLDIMAFFGIQYEWRDNEIRIPYQEYKSRDFYVESDWSSASYWYGLAALFPGSTLFLPDLFEKSSQGDSILREWMQKFGVHTRFTSEGCMLTSEVLRPAKFEKDMRACPDLIPTFVSLCTALRIPFVIQGSSTLQYKESPRAEVLKAELAKTGAIISLEEDRVYCEAYSDFPLEKILLHTHEDHRMAMSWMLQAAHAPQVRIENPAVTEKSYPGFWKDLETVGFRFEKSNIAS